MSIENRENPVEGLISQEARGRVNVEKRLADRHLEIARAFGLSTTMMAAAKRINPEAAKTLGLF